MPHHTIIDHHETTRLLITLILWQRLSLKHINVINDSMRHKAHREAQQQPDKGHFIVTISFSTTHVVNRLQQHRLIYSALGGLMARIHALSISVIE